MLLRLQDVHWADDASLDLIAGLLAAAPHARRCSCSPRRGPSSSAAARTGAIASPLTLRSTCGPSLGASRSLAAEILQKVPDAPEELREMLVEGADGNPFYLEELVKMLIEDGAIETGEEQWRVNRERLGQVRLPPTLSAVLQARLDVLPAAERLVLQRASIVGRQFWDRLVAELTPEVADVAPPLAGLQDRELIFRHDQRAFTAVQEYMFQHNILREATYETVLLQVRRASHAEIAAWLEVRAGERLGEYLTIIAGHYQQAGRHAEAARWYTRAGERAAALGANGDARALFETALELLPPGHDADRWRALVGHDEVVAVLGDSAARESDDLALAGLAAQTGNDRWVAEAHYRRGYYLQVLSRYEEALDALNAAVVAARRSGHDGLTPRALPITVLTLTRLGRMTEAGALAAQALASAEASGDPEVLARTLHNVSIYYGAAGDLGRAAQLIARQAEIMEQVGNLVGEAASLGNLGYYYLLLGRHAEARTALHEALTLSGVIGARREKLYNQLNLGLAYWRTGDDVAARRLLEDAIPELGALGDTFARASGQNYLGLAYERTDVAAAAAAFTEAYRAMSAIGVQGYAADAEAGLLRCAVAQRDLTAARVAVDELWAHLRRGAEGMEFPLLAYETCAWAFDLLSERDAAAAVGRAAYDTLMEQAAKISDEAWRECFLRAIPEHRALVERQAGLSYEPQEGI